jgi:hypothetical protein
MQGVEAKVQLAGLYDSSIAGGCAGTVADAPYVFTTIQEGGHSERVRSKEAAPKCSHHD